MPVRCAAPIVALLIVVPMDAFLATTCAPLALTAVLLMCMDSKTTLFVTFPSCRLVGSSPPTAVLLFSSSIRPQNWMIASPSSHPARWNIIVGPSMKSPPSPLVEKLLPWNLLKATASRSPLNTAFRMSNCAPSLTTSGKPYPTLWPPLRSHGTPVALTPRLTTNGITKIPLHPPTSRSRTMMRSAILTPFLTLTLTIPPMPRTAPSPALTFMPLLPP